MSVIYEKELALAKQDFIKSGGTSAQWKRMMEMSSYTLRDCGFKDAYEVARAARKNARRT